MATQEDFDRLSNWALLLNTDAGIDRRKCHRAVPMEVISAGMSRTGTLSMQEALRILGYPDPYHYSSTFANIGDVNMWIEACEAKFSGRGRSFGRDQFDQLLGHCGAVTDAPCCLFWRELIEAYPGAKVVLVERDEDRWYKSMEQLLEAQKALSNSLLPFLDPFWTGRHAKLGDYYVEGAFGTSDRMEALKNARERYRNHNAAVRSTVPQEKLLVYELGTGWEPLCNFLGKEVPKVPFPHRNEKATLDRAAEAFASKMKKRVLSNLGLVSGICSVFMGFIWQYIRTT